MLVDGIVHTNNSHRELYALCCCFKVIYCFCPMFLFGENLLASSKKLRRRKQVAGSWAPVDLTSLSAYSKISTPTRLYFTSAVANR